MGRLQNHDNLYCRALMLCGIENFLGSHDIEAAALLEKQNIVLSLPAEIDAFLSWNAVCTLFESAAREPGLAHFGLLLSASLSPSRRQVGPLIHLASLSECGREYMRLSARYQQTHMNGMAYTVHDDMNRDLVSWRAVPHPRSVYCRQMVEYAMSNSYRSFRQFLSVDGLHAVHFAYDPPEDRRLYDEMFDCPVIFNARHNQLTVRPAYFDKDLKAASQALLEDARDYLDHLTRKLLKSPASLSQTIQRILPSLFGVNRTDMRSVAGVFGMSEKKLQRLLRDEGTSYSALRNEARRIFAERLLSRTNIPIGRLAIFLDYTSSSAFNHACKRWFGVSPRKFRKGTHLQTPLP